MVATICQLRGELFGRKVLLFAEGEAACAALTKGAAKKKVALALVFPVWALAAQYDIALWAEAAPSKLNPADLPPRGRELSFETAPTKELPSNIELFSICNCARMLQ